MIQKCLIQREMAKQDGGFADVSSQFLIKLIKATAIRKLTAVTHFLVEFLRPPPPLRKVKKHLNILLPPPGLSLS